MLRRKWLPFKDVMAEGEKCEVEGVTVYVHHMDDQEGWKKEAVLHPLFKVGVKSHVDDWRCEFKHEYDTCKCHLELREYGQDESVYHSGDNPSSRWAVDGRSYAINKSRGISRMVSAFKDYTLRGLGLIMTIAELATVNAARVGAKYQHDQVEMEELKSIY